MSETTIEKAKRVRPTGTKLLVKREDAKEKTKGGIIIPNTAKEKTQMGVVIEAGPGKELDNGTFVKPEAKVNDRILFSEYSGTEVKIGGVAHIIIESGDVLAIIDDGTEVD